MSAQPRETEREEGAHVRSSIENKVNLNDLVNRLNLEKKKERKHNIILTAITLSSVAVFGIILTL